MLQFGRLWMLAAVVGCMSACGPGGASQGGGRSSVFPLVEKAIWVYDGSYKGRTYRRANQAVKRLVAGRTYWAFVDPNASGAQLLMGNMFGGDLFRADGSTVLVADQSDNRERLLFQLPLQPGQATVHVVGDQTTNTVVRGSETIEVPAGRFQCMRIDTITELEDGHTITGAIWLAPGIGLVKWDRGTGRIDQLITYAMP